MNVFTYKYTTYVYYVYIYMDHDKLTMDDEKDFAVIMTDSYRANRIFTSPKKHFWRAICNQVKITRIPDYYASKGTLTYEEIVSLVDLLESQYAEYADALTDNYWAILVEVAVVNHSDYLLDTINQLHPSTNTVHKTVLKSDIFRMLWDVYENKPISTSFVGDYLTMIGYPFHKIPEFYEQNLCASIPMDHYLLSVYYPARRKVTDGPLIGANGPSA